MIKYDSQFHNLLIAQSQFLPVFQRSKHRLDTLGNYLSLLQKSHQESNFTVLSMRWWGYFLGHGRCNTELHLCRLRWTPWRSKTGWGSRFGHLVKPFEFEFGFWPSLFLIGWDSKEVVTLAALGWQHLTYATKMFSNFSHSVIRWSKKIMVKDGL